MEDMSFFETDAMQKEKRRAQEDRMNELEAALQSASNALIVAVRGHSVRNMPHLMTNAERLLEGTDYPFTR